jgi:Nucleotidyl transferase AbiEii toxin, Type IV TA system
VSGESHAVTLVGNEASRLIVALERLAAPDAPPFTLVGGLAVLARLARPYRVTTDLDAVTLGPERDDFLEIIIGPGVRPGSGAAERNRLYIDDVKVDIIATGDIDLEGFDLLPEKQALFALAHHWAMTTSTLLSIADDTGAVATCLVATPAALVAMKLHALQDRRAGRPEKIASDCRDLYFLLESFDRDGTIGAAITAAPAPLPSLVVNAMRRELVEGAVRLERSMSVYSQATPQPPFADDLIFVAQRLIASLEEE